MGIRQNLHPASIRGWGLRLGDEWMRGKQTCNSRDRNCQSHVDLSSIQLLREESTTEGSLY